MAQWRKFWLGTAFQSFAKAGPYIETLQNGPTIAACSPKEMPTSGQVRIKSSRNVGLKNLLIIHLAWSGRRSIDDFIKVSKEGRANGDFIMHHENGTLVDLNLAKGRAVGKMKATITQRFEIDGIAFDVDCDSRFIFWCKKEGDTWKVQYKRVFYEKDKVVPVDGKTVPEFDKKLLEKYPKGYQYLAAAQHMIGHSILEELPTVNNKAFYKMYEAMHDWLEGKEVNLFWD